MPAHRIAWTPEMDKALIDGTRSGVGYRLLSEKIGVGRSTIERRRKELGLGTAPRNAPPIGVVEHHKRAKPEVTGHALSRAQDVLRHIAAAAENGASCPTNGQLADLCGYSSSAGPSGAISFLETAGLISVERRRNSRVVTICATGKRTAAPAPLRSQIRGGKVDRASAREKLDRLAEELANGAPSVPIAAKRAGLSVPLAWRYFARIRAELGPQAV